MSDGDFRASEQALTCVSDAKLRIEHVDHNGRITMLGDLTATVGDVLDAAVMDRGALARFMANEIGACRREGLLFALPLKCTSMRVSDPAIFSVAIEAYYASVIVDHGPLLETYGWNPAEGLQGFRRLIERLPEPDDLVGAIEDAHRRGPTLAIVDWRNSHSTLHAAGGTSIAAVMAAAMKKGGRCTGLDGVPGDTMFVIPNRSEAELYGALLEDLQLNGDLDPARIGSAIVVGLTADAADEYGAQEPTFEIERAGRVRIVDGNDRIWLAHDVAGGDLWRACRRSRRAIDDWFATAVGAAEEAGASTIFWLDEDRPRDRETLRRLRSILPDSDWDARSITVAGTPAAMHLTLGSLRRGDTIVTATGNLIRDYLGELVAALEIGASSSLEVHTDLVGGGVVFETGAAGCAPAVAVDFASTNHLRWNPLGDLFAWRSAFAQIGGTSGNHPCRTLAEGLDRAIARLLDGDLLPSKHLGGRDLRNTHFHLARLWSEELATHAHMKQDFADLAGLLCRSGSQIEREIVQAQRRPAHLGGHYHPDDRVLISLMNPSRTFSQALGGSPARCTERLAIGQE